jgi:single-stranded DNA-binding protein
MLTERKGATLMGNKITISGGVVAAPEFKKISDTFRVLEFPLYDNQRRKNKDTGEYENTGNVVKLKVILKNDLADAWTGKFGVGDIVEVSGTFTEREYDRKDGTKGRALETDWVETVEVKFSKTAATVPEVDPVF